MDVRHLWAPHPDDLGSPFEIDPAHWPEIWKRSQKIYELMREQDLDPHSAQRKL